MQEPRFDAAVLDALRDAAALENRLIAAPPPSDAAARTALAA